LLECRLGIGLDVERVEQSQAEGRGGAIEQDTGAGLARAQGPGEENGGGDAREKEGGRERKADTGQRGRKEVDETALVRLGEVARREKEQQGGDGHFGGVLFEFASKEYDGWGEAEECEGGEGPVAREVATEKKVAGDEAQECHGEGYKAEREFRSREERKRDSGEGEEAGG